jgi:CheY-like chemotaxis protein
MPEVRHVLVVEDNPTNQKLIAAVLVRAGYEVTISGTAASAREALARRRPDLMLMDIQLPDQDGLSFTRELQADEATRAIPIVALTAHAMVGDDRVAVEAGCVGYLTKPINTRTFAQDIDRFFA